MYSDGMYSDGMYSDACTQTHVLRRHIHTFNDISEVLLADC